jgi:acylphosphatase
MADLALIKATVHGRVKGIGFRAFVRAQARALRLSGYVRNLPDENTVEIEAEGEKTNLERLVSYLRVGPSLARVKGVEVNWSEYTGQYSDFSIRS